MRTSSLLVDVEAERDYLAHVFLDASVLSTEPLATVQFAGGFPRHVHAAAVALYERGEEIDTMSVRAEAGRAGVSLEEADLLTLTSTLPVIPPARLRDRIEELAAARSQRTQLVEVLGLLDAGDVEAARTATVALASRAEVASGASWTWLAEWSDDPIGEPPPARRWLLRRRREEDRSDGWLALGKAGMLASAGGVGKTMAAVQLALAVAAGRPWLGSIDVVEPGAVALLLAEEDREEILRRIYWAARALGLDEEARRAAAARILPLPFAGRPVALLELDDHGNLAESHTLRSLRRELRARGAVWRLVILDPLARLAPPEAERDNQIATRLVGAIESLCDVPGNPSVLVLHHTTKDARRGGRSDAQSARGSSAFSDGFRWSATLEPLARDGVRLEVVKSNYSAPGEPLYLRREEAGALRPMTVEERAEFDDEPTSRRWRSEAP